MASDRIGSIREQSRQHGAKVNLHRSQDSRLPGTSEGYPGTHPAAPAGPVLNEARNRPHVCATGDVIAMTGQLVVGRSPSWSLFPHGVDLARELRSADLGTGQRAGSGRLSKAGTSTASTGCVVFVGANRL
jgi:hypothetical protein